MDFARKQDLLTVLLLWLFVLCRDSFWRFSGQSLARAENEESGSVCHKSIKDINMESPVMDISSWRPLGEARCFDDKQFVGNMEEQPWYQHELLADFPAPLADINSRIMWKTRTIRK